jgi:uncharacterized membrane protein
MTSSQGSQKGGLMDTLAKSPVVGQLGEAAKDYAKARGSDAVKKIGEKLTGATGALNDTAESGGFKATAVGEAAKRVVQGDSPVKAALGGVGSGIKEKVSGIFGRSKSGGAGGNKKFMSIIEDIHVGAPVDVVYDQWTQFQEFASFMKGVDSVDQTDEVSSNWRVKVFKSRRNFKSTVTEQIPDRKIAWTTEGSKGTTKGVVTFHPLADDLTQVLLVIEYYPQGLFEKTGNIWRAQGRRTRLDLKHFRRFVMMRGEATGSWRGEIRDGEVVRTPEEVEQDEQEQQSGAEGEAEEGYEEEEPEEDEEEEPEEEAAEYEEPEEDEGEYEADEGEAEEGEAEEGEAEEGEYDEEEEGATAETEDEAEDEAEAEEEPEEEDEAEEPRAARRRARPARRGRRLERAGAQ